METTLIFGINLLVAVPTTLLSVWFASYRPLKDYPRNIEGLSWERNSVVCRLQ